MCEAEHRTANVRGAVADGRAERRWLTKNYLAFKDINVFSVQDIYIMLCARFILSFVRDNYDRHLTYDG